MVGVLCPLSAPDRQTVINDVAAMFENKSVEELAEQKTKIQDMLNSGEASVDSEYWEAVLKELHVFQVSVVLSLAYGFSAAGIRSFCESMANASHVFGR